MTCSMYRNLEDDSKSMRLILSVVFRYPITFSERRELRENMITRTIEMQNSADAYARVA